MAQKFDLFPAIGAEAVDLRYDRSATGAARRQGKIEDPPSEGPEEHANHGSLSRLGTQRTSTTVADLFDMTVRAKRRDRAFATGPELFLYERAFADCLERVSHVQRQFRRALLIGSPDPGWPKRLKEIAGQVEVRDPGARFAGQAGGELLVEDAWAPEQGAYDIVLAVGTLDSVNQLPLALRLIRHALAPGGMFLGALSGGETLPQLRSAMRAADAISGAAAPHVHPRIEASALAPLLADAGFVDPVVDVDRVKVSYTSLERLVGDLRAMGLTNVLTERPRFMSKRARRAAIEAFAAAGDGTRTLEQFEILHFAAWCPNKG
jgi:SAM-dependent methyltransferase